MRHPFDQQIQSFKSHRREQRLRAVDAAGVLPPYGQKPFRQPIDRIARAGRDDPALQIIGRVEGENKIRGGRRTETQEGQCLAFELWHGRATLPRGHGDANFFVETGNVANGHVAPRGRRKFFQTAHHGGVMCLGEGRNRLQPRVQREPWKFLGLGFFHVGELCRA